jgi:hypothetical protein
MPIDIRVDTNKHRVYAVLSGILTLNEMVEAVNTSVEDPAFRNGIDILSDHTRLEKPIETDEAKSLARHFQVLQEHFAGSRWAVVTKMEVSFGMMRMLSVFLEQVPMYLQVFYSFDEAERWLSSPKGTAVR